MNDASIGVRQDKKDSRLTLYSDWREKKLQDLSFCQKYIRTLETENRRLMNVVLPYIAAYRAHREAQAGEIQEHLWIKAFLVLEEYLLEEAWGDE